MVAVKTGFSSPSMPGMPAPMQPMMPMGGPGTFPSAPLPAGQTPVPPPMPPLPLAGFPPPPVKSPMAQQGSNAPRRRRFGDSLEGMLGRNMFAPQQQMVAPGMPMMRTPMPRPMQMGGIVQGFANGGNANQQAAASMMSAGIGNVGGKAITSGAQSIQDSFASSAAKRRKRRRQKQARLAAERAAAEQAIRDAEAAALAASQAAQQNNPNIAGPMESALQNFGGTAFQSAASSPAAPPPPPTDVTPEVFIPEVDAASTAEGFMNIEKPDRILDRQAALFPDLRDDDPAFTGALPPVSIKAPDDPFTYDIGAIGLGDNRKDRTASESVENAMLGMVNPDVDQSGVGLPSGLIDPEQGIFDPRYQEPRYQKDLIPDGYMSPDYPDMSMPMIPNVTAATQEDLARMVYPTNVKRYLAGEPRLGDTKVFLSDRIGFVDEKDLLNQGLNREGNPISPERLEDAKKRLAATQNFLSSRKGSDFYSPSFNLDVEAAKFLTDDQFTPPEEIYGDSPKIEGEATAFEQLSPVENFESTRAMLESNVFDPSGGETDAGQKITPPKAGSSNRTGVDPQADQYRSSVNAAEAAYLQEALGQMKFNKEGNLVPADPNFGQQVLNKIIRNLTLGMFDPDDPQKREDAKAILDAYRETGKFVYDSEGNAIDFSESLLGPDGKLDPDKLKAFDEKIKIFEGAGIEPAVTGVRDKEGNIVDFDDGTGFRNIMGDFDYKKGIGSDTQNILTGSTDVFGGNTNTGNTATEITTGGGDDGGSDGGGDVDTGHTVDEDGNKVCNTEGYVYNPETKICEPKKEEEEVDGTPGSGIGTGTSGESFEDVLKRVVVAAPDVAPISANVRPMQEGGMAGLNRAADNFLKALAG